MRWILLVLLSTAAWADETLTDAPPLADTATAEGEPAARPSLFGSLSRRQLLLVGLRLDASYQAGGVVVQGFSIPSVRLTAWGEAGEHISYRFSLGQTREFSTVLLPVVLPVEGYIDLHTPERLGQGSEWSLKFGLFTPTFNPWWSPDLSGVALPDYNETHRALFIGRDIGAEIRYEPVKDVLIHVGAFNGSGLFNLNTNNSKALTGGLRATFHVGNLQWMWGAAGFYHQQADSASVNYRSDWVANVFTEMRFEGTDWRIGAECFGGMLTDSIRTTGPFGMAATLQTPFFPGTKLFGRLETLNGPQNIQHAQAGTILDLDPALAAYIFYRYLDRGNGPENIGEVRFRLNL
ncbi:hypothetical protein K2X33_12160 [bacterium]|nr:hypothetical protein [bacterium]